MSWNVVAVVLAAEDEANCKDGRVECGKESLSVTALEASLMLNFLL